MQGVKLGRRGDESKESGGLRLNLREEGYYGVDDK